MRSVYGKEPWQAPTSDDLAIPLFALVREAARRTLGQEHVPEQIVAGLALKDGYIVEMKTGEGKTLAATQVCAFRGYRAAASTSLYRTNIWPGGM